MVSGSQRNSHGSEGGADGDQRSQEDTEELYHHSNEVHQPVR